MIKEKSEKITVVEIKALYEQNRSKKDVDQKEVKKLEINNSFLESAESVLVIRGKKKLNKKDSKGKDVKDDKGKVKKVDIEYFQNIYMQLLPKDLQGIEIDNLALKINRFPLMELKNKDEVKFHFQDSYCVEYEQKKIDDYYSAIKKLPLNFSKLPDFKTSYRLVIGGEATVYETSMRLHHIYGIPYIPASGIKGVVRSYIITEKFATELENYKDRYMKFEEEVLFAKDKEGEYIEKEFVDVFGSQDHAGEVTFFDAFPIEKPTLKVDIINPIDEDKIINFLTVENTTFRFVVASKIEKITFKEKRFLVWFKKALQNHGLGAKTAVGYGYFGG